MGKLSHTAVLHKTPWVSLLLCSREENRAVLNNTCRVCVFFFLVPVFVPVSPLACQNIIIPLWQDPSTVFPASFPVSLPACPPPHSTGQMRIWLHYCLLVIFHCPFSPCSPLLIFGCYHVAWDTLEVIRRVKCGKIWKTCVFCYPQGDDGLM